MPVSVPGKVVSLDRRCESAATITLAGQGLSVCEDAELVRLDVLQALFAHRVGLRLCRHILQLVIVLDAPAGKFPDNIVVDTLLFRISGEMHANGTNQVRELKWRFQAQECQVLEIIVCPAIVVPIGIMISL